MMFLCKLIVYCIQVCLTGFFPELLGLDQVTPEGIFVDLT